MTAEVTITYCFTAQQSFLLGGCLAQDVSIATLARRQTGVSKGGERAGEMDAGSVSTQVEI